MPAKIHYFTLKDETPRKDKLDWFRDNALSKIELQRLHPDEKGNWLNITDNDFETLLPLASKEVKGNKAGPEFDKAVFKLFSLGVVTNRDEWVYDFDKDNLEKKVRFFCEFYEREKIRWQASNKTMPINDFVDRTIKWTEELENHMKKGSKLSFENNRFRETLYRPFTKQLIYLDKIITHRIYQNDFIFGVKEQFYNRVMYVSGISTSKSFQVLVTNKIAGLDFLEKTQCLPLYRYDESGNRIENITDWGLEQFRGIT